MADLKIGTKVKDRYTLKEFKGSGSFGEVWLAHDEVLDSDIAIKIYISLDPRGVEEFKSEYITTQGISNPNLLTTTYFDVWKQRPFLVMKYCSKGSTSLLAGNTDEYTIWNFIHDVAAGLKYLHNMPEPIIHQDIKPDNILQSDTGFVITDFGISKKIRSTMRKQSRRAVGAGATAYMGPERFESDPTPVKASDIWSLGASIYELATGELPFSGLGGGMQRNGAEMPSLDNKWSKDMNMVMQSCLAKETWDRPTAEQLEEYADAIIKGEPAEVTWKLPSINEVPTPEPQEEYIEDETEEPSKWTRFLNRICGVGTLANANRIPAGRKITYLIAFTILIITSAFFPIGGWLFVAFTYKSIRAALQRLFFAGYLEEWDVAAGYSKTKAITIVTLIILIPVSLGILIFSINRSINNSAIAQSVTNISALCPFQLFDVTVSSASYVDGDVFITCHSTGQINPSRDRLDSLNIELLKPALLDESLPFYKIAKDNNITFNFFNNGVEMKSITISPKEIEKYKSLSDSERGQRYVSSFIELENTYMPLDLGADVKMTHILVDTLSLRNNGGKYLKFTFADPHNEMARQFGDSISYKVAEFIPLGLPFFAKSVAESTDGIKYEINNGTSTNIENIIYTSNDIRQMLQQRIFPQSYKYEN